HPGDPGAELAGHARPPARRAGGRAFAGQRSGGGRPHHVIGPETAPRPALAARFKGLAGAAVLIGLLTILARVAGFGRTVVFSATVHKSCLSDAYFTANQIPNIIFEIVAGGALAGMVVPVLAGPAEQGDRGRVEQI